MSPGAWIMMLATWGVVIGVSSYLLWKVLARPEPPGGGGERTER